MQDGLYHHTLGLPPIKLPNLLKLRYSKHAQAAVFRYPFVIYPPAVLHTQKCQIVEAEVDKGEVVKIVARLFYNPKLDLVLALHLDGFALSG